MKILIGTPINECKDYCMERWLENVAKLQQQTPADFLMVDNSPGLDYMKKVREYCTKYGVKNYKIEHLEINKELSSDEKISRSREIIRQYILSRDYDAWFSWESDQIIPTDALEKLAGIMEKGNFMMINPNTWERSAPSPNAGLGCALVRKDALEKHGFLLEYYSDMPQSWHGGEEWFKKHILKDGGNYIEIFGAIGPIYHLKE